MATNPTFPSVKTYLKAELAQRSALTGVQIEYGYPGDEIEKECIWLGAVDGNISVPTMMAGRHSRDEAYNIDVIIDVLLEAGTCEEAELRACAFLNDIDNFVAEDLTLEGLVQALTLGDFRVQTLPSSQSGAVSRIQLQLVVSNRLT